MINLSKLKPLSNIINDGLRRKDLGDAARWERCCAPLRRSLSFVDDLENSRDGLVILISSPEWLMERDVEEIKGSRPNAT